MSCFLKFVLVEGKGGEGRSDYMRGCTDLTFFFLYFVFECGSDAKTLPLLQHLTSQHLTSQQLRPPTPAPTPSSTNVHPPRLLRQSPPRAPLRPAPLPLRPLLPLRLPRGPLGPQSPQRTLHPVPEPGRQVLVPVESCVFGYGMSGGVLGCAFADFVCVYYTSTYTNRSS